MSPQRNAGRALVALVLFALPVAMAGAQQRVISSAPAGKHVPADRAVEVPGEILVGFERGVSASARAAARRATDVQVLRALGLEGVQLVKTEPGRPTAQAIAALERRPGVRYAEPNRYVRPAITTPNEPLFERLWGLNNTGQEVVGLAGLEDSDIDAVEGWDVLTGGQTLVAVVDEGVAYDHPDLSPNMWRNPGETPGNGLDDDGNGRVDDVHGIDTVDRDGDPAPVGADEEHGTHVAGTIAAAGNNGQGVAGVSWEAQVMAVRALGPGGGSTATAAEAFRYAAAMGARVINASLGGSGRSQTLQDAITAHPDTLFVVAAGNDGADNDAGQPGSGEFPCNYENLNVICVAATDQRDQLALFSNFGTTSVDIAAPGANIWSTGLGGDIVLMQGTSMATPHVAGAATLLLARNPELTVAQARDLLLTTGDAIPSLDNRLARYGPAGGQEQERRLNLGALMTQPALGPVPPVATTGGASGVTEAAATLNGTLAPRGSATGYRFDFGPTAAYGSSTPRVDAGAGDAGVAVTAALTGLTAATTYHFRLVAVRGSVAYPGRDRTFTTAAAVPASAPQPAPAPAGAAPAGGPAATPPSTSPAAPSPSIAPSRTVDRLAALTRSARATCRRRGRRVLCVVRADGPAAVALRLRKGRRLVGTGRGAVGAVVRLAMRGRIARGVYRLELTFTVAGARRSVRTTVRVR